MKVANSNKGLCDVPVWRKISLDRIGEIGERFEDWPGGAGKPSDRGARGIGGILWDIREMSVWASK